MEKPLSHPGSKLQRPFSAKLKPGLGLALQPKLTADRPGLEKVPKISTASLLKEIELK